MGFRTVDKTLAGRGGALERGLFSGKLKVNRSGTKSTPLRYTPFWCIPNYAGRLSAWRNSQLIFEQRLQS